MNAKERLLKIYLDIVGHPLVDDKDHPKVVRTILNKYPQLRTLFRDAAKEACEDGNDATMNAIKSLFPPLSE